MTRNLRWPALALTLGLGCPAAPQSETEQAAPLRPAPSSPTPAPPTEEDALAPHPSHPLTPAQIRTRGNHLVDEPSPYLAQHAHHGIDWYPWGEAAFAAAKHDGKLILLSIGYSTCHWCHVMAHEVFENDEVAAFVNDHFVAIKVDREQRPDIDQIYLNAVDQLGGTTGWPLNVFATPELTPITGVTYLPAMSDGRRPGFLDLARSIDRAWHIQGPSVATRGQEIFDRMARDSARPATDGRLDRGVLDDAMNVVAEARDMARGGFGTRQKFPQAPLLLAELRYARSGTSSLHKAAEEHLLLTLERMLSGGLRDHLGGTFHRYAVDPNWHTPHFEKTLYDNAQLAAIYLEAGRVWSRPEFEQTARLIFDDLITQWRAPGGGFVVGFDADDALGEGTYYTWTERELVAALGPETGLYVAQRFGLHEPHADDRAADNSAADRRSTLSLADDAMVRTVLGIDLTADPRVAQAMPLLRKIRNGRPAPARDDKVILAYNALAIASLAEGARWLSDDRYARAATEAAQILLRPSGNVRLLQRGTRDGTSLGPAMLEDYALLGLALLRLHAATGDLAHLTEARTLGRVILERFYDATRAGFTAAERTTVSPVAILDMSDGPLPAGGTAALALLLQLSDLAGDDALRIQVLELLGRWASYSADRADRAGFLWVTIDQATATTLEAVLCGGPDHPATRPLLRELARADTSRIRTVRLPAQGAPVRLIADYPNLAGKAARAGRPTAYVCEHGSCRLPTSDPQVLRKQLEATQAR